jgi:hypothetical protein
LALPAVCSGASHWIADALGDVWYLMATAIVAPLCVSFGPAPHTHTHTHTHTSTQMHTHGVLFAVQRCDVNREDRAIGCVWGAQREGERLAAVLVVHRVDDEIPRVQRLSGFNEPTEER